VAGSIDDVEGGVRNVLCQIFAHVRNDKIVTSPDNMSECFD